MKNLADIAKVAEKCLATLSFEILKSYSEDENYDEEGEFLEDDYREAMAQVMEILTATYGECVVDAARDSIPSEYETALGGDIKAPDEIVVWNISDKQLYVAWGYGKQEHPVTIQLRIGALRR